MGRSIEGIRIGDLIVDPPVFLAPMSGVTDRPFRTIVKRLGAGLVISEMIASHEMVRAGRRSLRTSTDCAEEHPMAVQLAGYDPAIMAEAARLNVDRGAAIIDINFGCPAKKVVTKLCGSALMREPDLAARIVEAVSGAVDVPVTVKMRLGWDDDSRNAPDLAFRCETAGARLVTVHGRTRCQFYSGQADWLAVRSVVDALSVPVVVNGDISDAATINKALEASGAHGVMIGRGVQGRPWRLGQAADYLRTGTWPDDPDLLTRCRIALEHYDLILEHYGREKGLKISRKHMTSYINDLPGAGAVRQRINRLDNPDQVTESVSSFFISVLESDLEPISELKSGGREAA